MVELKEKSKIKIGKLKDKLVEMKEKYRIEIEEWKGIRIFFLQHCMTQKSTYIFEPQKYQTLIKKSSHALQNKIFCTRNDPRLPKLTLYVSLKCRMLSVYVR